MSYKYNLTRSVGVEYKIAGNFQFGIEEPRMPSPRPLLITLSSVVLFVVFALPLTASAQVLAPHKPVPPVLPQPKA